MNTAEVLLSSDPRQTERLRVVEAVIDHSAVPLRMSISPWHHGGMTPTRYRIGDLVRLHHDYNEHPLPEGLPAGAEVRIVGLVQTYRLVEWEGELFEIDMFNIEAMNGAA